MGKKKKIFLEFKRFGKIKKKWETKFANLLGLVTTNKVEEVAETPKDETIEEVVVEVEEKPKTTRKKRTPAKKTTTSTKKKTTSTTRKRRTAKTKTDA